MGETGLGSLAEDNEAASGGGLGDRLRNPRVLAVLALLLVGLLLGLGFALRSRRPVAEEKAYPITLLYDNLTDDQASRVTQELSFLGIKFETHKTGKISTVSVPENKVDYALQRLAQKGLPLGGAPGFELFDKDDGLGATEFDKRIKYIRAVSGEIERSIARLEQVKIAKVQIVIPEKKLFAINQDPVKASVLLELQPQKKLAPEQIYGIIQLTAHSVEGLLAKDVSVVDNLGNVLSQGVLDLAYRGELRVPAETQAALPPHELVEKNGSSEAGGTQPPAPIGADWIKAKQTFEAHLKTKASQSLSLLLPPESFKIEVDVQFKAWQDQVPIIGRVVCSLMIDSGDERIYLDEIEKKKIFAALSDAIGYKSGRDQIVLRRVSFRTGAVPTDAAKANGSNAVNRNNNLPMTLLRWAAKVPWRAALGAVILLATGLWFLRLRRLRAQAAQATAAAEGDLISPEPPLTPTAAREPSLKEVLAAHQEDIAQLQRMASETPDRLAALLQVWLEQPEARTA